MKKLILILSVLSLGLASFADNENYYDKNVSGQDFSNRSLKNSNWTFANATGTNFQNSNLTNANFNYSTLTNADFTDATIMGAYLYLRTSRGFTKEQLYSTASYKNKDLSRVNLSKNDLTGWDFHGQNLTNAHFEYATLTNANFTDTIITRAYFQDTPFYGLTKEQLYSTASYKNKDLRGISLSYNDLTGWDFHGQNLTSASFYNDILTDADFTDATITGASFGSTTSIGFTKEQLYSTASYKNKDLSGVSLSSNTLTGWDFSGQNLTSANFGSSTLTNTDFTDATITGANFKSAIGFTNEQLYSTASYKNKDLSGVRLGSNNLTGCDFSGFNLTNAVLPGNLSEVTFNSADLTGVDFTDKELFYTDFSNTKGFTKEKLYSTASYKNKDLSGIGLGGLNINAWSFVGHDLNNSDFSGATITDVSFVTADLENALFDGAILTNVTFRGAKNFVVPENATMINVTLPNGTVVTTAVQITSAPPASLEVSENAKYDLKVSATERSGKALSFSWFVDKGKGFVKAGSGAKIVITPKANMLGWQYYCEVSNGSETRKTSVSTIVAVKAPAKIVGKIAAVEAFEGVANRGFTVSATGDNLSYQWEISRDKGKTWQQISGATSSTYIPESDPDLNGAMYRCRVYNEGSSVYSASAKFTVREAPKVEEVEVFQSKIQLPFEGSTVVAYEDYPIDLKATAKGYKIKYQWYKNGAAIKGATKATYSIKKPLESQDSYYCAVFNGNVASQSSEFVLDIRPCPLPLDFAARSIAITGESELFGNMNLSLLFTAKTTLKLACSEYAVSNSSWSFKRTSPTSGTASLKFKLYTDDEPISKLNTLSLAYTGTLEFDEADGIYYLDLFNKKLGEFNATFTDADMEVSVKTALETLPLNKNITIGGEVVRLLDKKNFSCGSIRGTYTYKWNKNGTGLLKLTWSEGKDKFTKEVSLFALTAKSGIAIVSTSWNEAKSKFMDSACVDFEIK